MVQVVLQAFVLTRACTWSLYMVSLFHNPFDPNLWKFPHRNRSATSSCCCPARYRSHPLFWATFSLIRCARQSLSPCSTTNWPCHICLELTSSEQWLPRLCWTSLVGNPLFHRMTGWNEWTRCGYPGSGKGAAPASVGTTDLLAEEPLRLLMPASIFSRRGEAASSGFEAVKNWLSFMNASKKRENTSEKQH